MLYLLVFAIGVVFGASCGNAVSYKSDGYYVEDCEAWED